MNEIFSEIKSAAAKQLNWRAHLNVHPAASAERRKADCAASEAGAT
jgi:hypothetical protein